MTVSHVCGIAILLAVCAAVVKEVNPRGFSYIGILGAVMLFSFALLRYSEPITYISRLAARAGVSEYVSLVLKVLALGYGVGISADLCRDMGETRIASSLEIVGRAECLLLCMPAFTDIIDLALGLVNR